MVPEQAARERPMSASGQNRTSGGHLGYVRFTPESGHLREGHSTSAKCHEETFLPLPHRLETEVA